MGILSFSRLWGIFGAVFAVMLLALASVEARRMVPVGLNILLVTGLGQPFALNL